MPFRGYDCRTINVFVRANRTEMKSVYGLNVSDNLPNTGMGAAGYAGDGFIYVRVPSRAGDDFESFRDAHQKAFMG